MTHIHSKTGTEFQVGKVVDFDGKDYDICVIFRFPDQPLEDDVEELEEPEFVDYYFGDYDEQMTDDYIDGYLSRQ